MTKNGRYELHGKNEKLVGLPLEKGAETSTGHGATNACACARDADGSGARAVLRTERASVPKWKNGVVARENGAMMVRRERVVWSE